MSCTLGDRLGAVCVKGSAGIGLVFKIILIAIAKAENQQLNQVSNIRSILITYLTSTVLQVSFWTNFNVTIWF